MVARDYEQKRANRALVGLAIKTAVRVQTAVEVEQEARQMREREVAFRRLVKANGGQQERTNKAKSEQKEKQKEAKHKGKTSNQKGEQTRAEAGKTSEVENSDPRRYEKKAEVIRSREPKIPWLSVT